jgi:release factor family 10
MLRAGTIQALPDLPAPLLTIYLDTNPTKQMIRGLKPDYVTRFESQAKLIEQAVPTGDLPLFLEQVQRAGTYLVDHRLQCRGVAIFAGLDTWELMPVQVEVEDEVRWGAPALAQLFWLLDEHKPHGIVLAGQKRAQIFLWWLGEMLELEEKEFRMEPSKQKEMGPVSRPAGVRVPRGTDHDVFEHHVDAQYAHYYRQIAEHVGLWCAAEHLDSLFLVGLIEMTKGIRRELPQWLREKTTVIEKDLGWVESRTELEKRIEPFVEKHEREREAALIDDLLGESRAVVIGIDETLVQLQQGRIRNLAVVKSLDGSLQQCLKCSWADRTQDSSCPACGGERQVIRLREVLPQLVRRYKVSVDVVAGEAARRLQEAGGMGAWLRETEKKEYAQA